jgi:hypothetical protein
MNNNKKKKDELEELDAFVNATSTSTGNNPFSSNTLMNGWSILSQEMEPELDLTDIFIEFVKDVDEEDVIKMLDVIKELQFSNYLLCLFNLIKYPNFKLMSEKFLVDRYEDIKTAEKNLNLSIDFRLVYGDLLKSMPSLSLLLEINKDKGNK